MTRQDRLLLGAEEFAMMSDTVWFLDGLLAASVTSDVIEAHVVVIASRGGWERTSTFG